MTTVTLTPPRQTAMAACIARLLSVSQRDLLRAGPAAKPAPPPRCSIDTACTAALERLRYHTDQSAKKHLREMREAWKSRAHTARHVPHSTPSPAQHPYRRASSAMESVAP